MSRGKQAERAEFAEPGETGAMRSQMAYSIRGESETS
jgi:hypothetical protein